MPFKSQAQRRKFAQLLVEGKISNQTFEEWNRETGKKKLPERVSLKHLPATKQLGLAKSGRQQSGAVSLNHSDVAMARPLDRIRRLCLALPNTWEKLFHGEPTFWVGKRMFCQLRER